MKEEPEILKTIIADTDIETFEVLKKISDKYNVIFLSSDFAINFILEYERIDLVLISNKISNLNSIIERTKNKKIKLLVFGRDLKYPVSYQMIEDLLNTEQEKKIIDIEKNNISIKKRFKKILSDGRKFFDDNNKKDKNIHEEEDSKKLDILDKINNKKVEKKNAFYPEETTQTTVNSIEVKKGKLLQTDKTSDKKTHIETAPHNMKIVKQKIMVLAKAKGGVGSTTIGIFLSSVLKEFSTLLIDLNFNEGGGDIGYYLNIPKSPNILNFLNGYSKEALDDSIIRVRENLDILQSPPTFDQSKNIELQDIYCITDIAKKKYHILIIDLPNHLGDMWLGAIDLADLLILVSDLSLGSIGRLVKINNRYLYKGLEKLLVLNMHGKQNGIDLTDTNVGNFFNLENFILIEENERLRQKTDFSDFNFTGIKDLNRLKDKVLEIISN